MTLPAPIICQKKLPIMPWMAAGGVRLPGLSPVSTADWLVRDDVFAAQMAYRDHLVKNRQAHVYACLPQAEPSARELLEILLAELPSNDAAYTKRGSALTRPDNISIETKTTAPLLTAGRLAQEDFALMQKEDGTYRLTGGLICFPAHWQLQRKIGKTLTGLHAPVAEYTADIAARTLRIFDHLRPETPLMRANVLIYTNPDLHQPAAEKKTVAKDAPRFVRVERQTLRRLPRTGAIAFAIHTYQIPAQALAPEQFAALAARRPDIVDG